MSPRAGPWGRWVAPLARQEPGTGLALVRILLAAVALYTLASLWLTGIWALVWTPADIAGYRPLAPPHLFRWLGGADPARVQGVMALWC